MAAISSDISSDSKWHCGAHCINNHMLFLKENVHWNDMFPGTLQISENVLQSAEKVLRNHLRFTCTVDILWASKSEVYLYTWCSSRKYPYPWKGFFRISPPHKKFQLGFMHFFKCFGPLDPHPQEIPIPAH